jgi:hypothetical protein
MMMANKEIDQIKTAAGEYAKEAMEGRKMFLDLRLRQDPEIRKIYIRAADRIAAQIAKGGSTPLRKKQLAGIMEQLRQEAGQIEKELTAKLDEHLMKGVEAGGWQSRTVTVKLFEEAKTPLVKKAELDRMYVRVNREAVNAIWNRTKNGMQLSDRIWKTSRNSETVIKNLIQDAVASGQDAVTTAKMLQQYIRKDALTLVKSYPNIMSRMKGRVPKNLSYEALRLARTETTAAFGHGSIKAAQSSPSAKGIQYCLSSAHHIVDICDELARNNEADLGPGVYAVDDPPPYPAHPNTMSYLVTKHESPDDFVKRLKEWEKNPGSDEDLEKWYNNSYQKGSDIALPGGKTILGSLQANKILTPEQKALYLNIRGLSAKAKEGLAKTFDDALKYGAVHNQEIIYKIDVKTGKHLQTATGDREKIFFTQEFKHMLRTAAQDSLISVHNHVENRSFSGADLGTLAVYQSIKYMMVAEPGGTRYLMRIGKGTRFTIAQQTQAAYTEIYLKHFDRFKTLYDDGKLTLKEAYRQMTHTVATEFAKKYGWEYRQYLPGRN